MGVSYMLQFLDKQTLGQSAIMGILQDLVCHPTLLTAPLLTTVC
jgi:hypothetical protein